MVHFLKIQYNIQYNANKNKQEDYVSEKQMLAYGFGALDYKNISQWLLILTFLEGEAGGVKMAFQ